MSTRQRLLALLEVYDTAVEELYVLGDLDLSTSSFGWKGGGSRPRPDLASWTVSPSRMSGKAEAPEAAPPSSFAAA
jgi:hypothetical protein